MNRDKYIDLYIHILKVKWSVDKGFHTTASKTFKSKGWYSDLGSLQKVRFAPRKG